MRDLAERLVSAVEEAAGGVAAVGRAAERLAGVAEKGAEALLPLLVERLKGAPGERRQLEGAVVRSLPLPLAPESESTEVEGA